MNALLQTVIAGLVVLILAKILGLNDSKVTVHHGRTARKSGKWIMLISWALILGGLAWAGKYPGVGLFSNPGYVMALYGLLILPIGKVISWFQRD